MRKLTICAALLVAVVIAGGCDRDDAVLQPASTDQLDLMSTATAEMAKQDAEYSGPARCDAPEPLVTIASGYKSLTFWPYTGDNFLGTPQDPINVIFCGKADPRDIRAALMSLDGDRSAFGLPPVAPFNSTWQDAIGDVQAGYGDQVGWVGGVVQLACGDYQPVRFHLRLFKMGSWTVGNAHFEVLIPNTTEHQVLSWELAEQLVTIDLMRCGLLDSESPITPTGPINDSPFRTIPAMIYNGLPVELRQTIGGPLGDVSEDVPIATDGNAVVFKLSQRLTRPAEELVQDFVINFDQVIPRPFCSSGPLDFVYVVGPVHLRQVTSLDRGGDYSFDFQASGTLYVTPVDPLSGTPSGPTVQAVVTERHNGKLNSRFHFAESVKLQMMSNEGDADYSSLFVKIHADSRGRDKYRKVEQCGPEPGVVTTSE